MADIVVKADGSPGKKEINSLNLRDGNVFDGQSKYTTETDKTKPNKQVIPSTLSMADLVRILADFSANMAELKESVNKLSLIVNSDLKEMKENLEKLNSFNCIKTFTCTDGKNNSCGTAKYDRGIIEINVDLRAHNDIFLFDNTFAKIDTSFTFSLDVDSTPIVGNIIEKEDKYFLCFPKLEKYPVTGLQFSLSAI